MGKLLRFARHAEHSAGQRSGLNSERETPVSRSIGSTNSAGTPRLERNSQYQTCPWVVPIRSAKRFWPPASLHARFKASEDMGLTYPNLGESQPRNMLRTANLKFSRLVLMREIDPVGFGRRVARRRKKLRLSQNQLARDSGQTTSNIQFLECGRARKSRTLWGHAQNLASVLQTSPEWLCWEEGREDTGRRGTLSERALIERYRAMTPGEKHVLSGHVDDIEEKRGKPQSETS